MLNPKVVLTVDDDPLVHLMVEAFFRNNGAQEIITASDGADGLRKLDGREADIDLIVVDLNMPLLDGVGFLRALRTALELYVVWTVVLTTSDQSEILGAAREAGADEVFVKPQSQQELATIAARMLDGALRVRSR